MPTEGIKPGKLNMELMKKKVWTADDLSSWALTRQRRRRHFIITRGVPLRGLPLGLCLFALHVWLVEPRDVLLAFMNVPGWMGFGWLYGCSAANCGVSVEPQRW
jgi:hypothetical protein